MECCRRLTPDPAGAGSITADRAAAAAYRKVHHRPPARSRYPRAMNALETHATRSAEQAPRAARSLARAKACLVALAALAGCGSRTIVGAGVAHSYGSVSVAGNESGIGGGVQVGHYFRVGSDSLGVVASADLAGYAAGGDADPILWSELQVRYRHDLRGHGQPGSYVALGPTLGYAGGYIDDVVAGGVFELGYELRILGPVALDLSLRERPAYFMGGGTPFGELHNTLTLGLDLVLLGPAPAR
jgi:hypothetical protein